MLSSISLGSIDNLEKLPINSLNSICERVRQALLHVFLPRLCEKCQPAFSEAFRKTQSTPLLLKALCEPCKINYVKDKRSVSRKKVTKPDKIEPNETSITTIPNSTTTLLPNSTTTKLPAKRKQKEVSRSPELSPNDNLNNNQENSNNFGKLKVKIKLISATKLETTTTRTNNANPLMNPICHPLPLTPPPTEDDVVDVCKVKLLEPSSDNNVTIFIDNSEFNPPALITSQIYEYFNEKGVDWCRYCGVAGDTGTFWKLGPWGDRTLCHKHGCEFFGCGFARVTKTRLDLTKFYGEKRSDRNRPIISEYCSTCWLKLDDDNDNDDHVSCNGCPLSYHKTCLNHNGHSHSSQSPFYCTENCHDNFEKCLIRPQFHSKSSFPFYRQILTVEDTTATKENNLIDVKIRLQVPKRSLSLTEQVVVKKRKYNHRKQNENQVDRVIAFLPIKVDQTVHQHENIKTPQWTKKSLQERLNPADILLTTENFITEELDDQILLDRHARYEHVEKTTRLLKPGVLKQLISGQL